MLNEKQIRKIIAEATANSDWMFQDKTITFEALGLDSLDRFAILAEVQEAVEIEFPDEDVEQLQSIAAIEAYLADK